MSEKSFPQFRISAWFWIGIAIIILFLVAYPKPALFVRSIERAVNPPIDPSAVTKISQSLTDDPTKIEAWVIEHIQRDANDYANWGVIFYIASPAEVLSIGRGPCYGRAVGVSQYPGEQGHPLPAVHDAGSCLGRLCAACGDYLAGVREARICRLALGSGALALQRLGVAEDFTQNDAHPISALLADHACDIKIYPYHSPGGDRGGIVARERQTANSRIGGEGQPAGAEAGSWPGVG